MAKTWDIPPIMAAGMIKLMMQMLTVTQQVLKIINLKIKLNMIVDMHNLRCLGHIQPLQVPYFGVKKWLYVSYFFSRKQRMHVYRSLENWDPYNFAILILTRTLFKENLSTKLEDVMKWKENFAFLKKKSKRTIFQCSMQGILPKHHSHEK